MAAAIPTIASVLGYIIEGQKLVRGFFEAFNNSETKYEMRHNLKSGNPSEDDICLRKEEQRVGYNFFVHGTCARKVYHFKFDKTITGIVVIDNWTDDTGGNADIKNGGVGKTFVDIEIVAKPFRGFDFTIVIIGKK